MEHDKLDQLIKIYGEEKLEIIKYYELQRQIESIIKMDDSNLEKLKTEIIYYYNFVLDNFGNIDGLGNIGDYVMFLYKIRGLDKVLEFISERFSVDNYCIELKESNNNLLYMETFYRIKDIFNKVVIAWKNNEDTDRYFIEINNLLDSIYCEVSFITNCFENREDLMALLYKKLNDLKSNINDKKFLRLDDDINSFVVLINNLFDMSLSDSLIKRNILDILREENGLKNIGEYRNILVNVIDKSLEEGLEKIEIDEDSLNFYLALEVQLYDYIDQSINNKDTKDYYKRYLSSNMFNYLKYDNKKNICIIYASKINEFFRTIKCCDVIKNIFNLMNIKDCYNKITMDFVLKFEQFVKDIDAYDYNKEDLEKIYLLYKHSVECSELSNLDKLFIKKRVRNMSER